jgi:hypothetical protein
MIFLKRQLPRLIKGFKSKLSSTPICIYASFSELIGPIVPSKLRARMVDYNNPATIAREQSAHVFSACSPINWSVFSTAAIVHFWHVVDGLYMYVSLPGLCAFASSIYVTTQRRTSVLSWDFFTTLDYEWDVIRGRRPYRWTIWVCGLLSGFVIAHSMMKD